MTAEIVIMNKRAVALAADSAASIQTPGGTKVSNTARKLFAFSKKYPVGIMVYGGSEISTVPWELIIKQHRVIVDASELESIDNYCDQMIDFIKNNPYFTTEAQVAQVKISAYSFFDGINEQVVSIVLDNKDNIPDINSRFDEILTDKDREISEIGKSESLGDLDYNIILENYKDVITIELDKIEKYFPIKLNAENKQRMISLFINHLLSNEYSDHCSGIVIAGYGKNDHYPSMCSFETDGLICGKLKLTKKKCVSVDTTTPSIIAPFAQQDMADLFIYGIDSFYKQILRECAEDLLKSGKEVAFENLSINKETIADDLKESIDKSLKSKLEDFNNLLQDYEEQVFAKPVIDAIAFLDKSELALFAENLVSLTALKRKISPDAETVGGPVDVAVISKVNGFVWIKRKHYFSPELNPRFLRSG